MAGCGKADNNGKKVSGSKLTCGVKLTYGTGKEPRRTETHLCKDCTPYAEETDEDELFDPMEKEDIPQ